MSALAIAKEIRELPEPTFTYSICTLVTNQAEYTVMLDSFLQAGFSTDFCEYIYIDNSQVNQYDAYAGLNKMLSLAKGKYIILCHQDIELKFDKIDALEKRIAEVNALDPNWGILSNAGGLHLKQAIQHISHPHNEVLLGTFPFKVKSVDENFMLFKKNANLSFSRNMKGFHMYGTDCCIIADMLGYNAWVVDFHLMHKSQGNMNKSFYENKSELIQKYQHAFRSRYVRTPCTKLYISGSGLLTSVMNTKLSIFITKLGLKIKRLMKGTYLFE